MASRQGERGACFLRAGVAKQSIQATADAKKELFVFEAKESPSIPQQNTMNEPFCPALFFFS